jgi:UDP-N-acetylmuramoylalanine--D-glutamate ligase
MEYKNYFKGKKITMLGLGLLGRGVNVAKFLAKQGALLTITDLKTEEQLASSLSKLKKFKNITYRLGEHVFSDFQDKDLIIKSAGVPLDSVYIAEARKNNIPIEMDASLFAKLTDTTLVGVTGSKGKSTVTHLLYEIIKNSGRRVYLGGNVRGLATLPLLKKVKTEDVVVMELDSWQLQGFGESGISPTISIFTSFFPDHLNYYKGSMEAYFRDKEYIYSSQKENDHFLLTIEVERAIKKYGRAIPKGRQIIFSEKDVPKNWKVKILGEHNRVNMAGAILAARLLLVPEKIIKKTIESFSGVSGRMELVATKKGVAYYNDTAATAPGAALLSVKTLGSKNNIIFLGGGMDKNADYTALVKAMKGRVKKAILFAGTGTDKIVELLPKNLSYVVVDGMKEAFNEVGKVAKRADIVLLSPAAASFGIFKNEFDRGDQFIEYVKKLV